MQRADAARPEVLKSLLPKVDDALPSPAEQAERLILWLGKNQPRDLVHAHRAFEELEVGGVKKSGLGREEVRFAMEDMTEIRLMVYASLDHAAADKTPR